MARGMNHVFMIGSFAREPELRFASGGSLAIFEGTIAGETHVDGKVLPFYQRVEMLGKPAQWQAERGYQAGQPVFVEGSLDFSSWEAEGKKRSAIRIKAQRIEPLGHPVQLNTDAGGGVRMAGGLNEVWLVGNLARDAILRQTTNGHSVLSASIGVSERWISRDGQPQEKTHWIDLSLWRELAQANANLRKGDPVAVRGRLTNDSWTDNEGNKRNSVKVEVNYLEVLARGTGAGGPVTSPGMPQQAMSSMPQQSYSTYPSPYQGGGAPQSSGSYGAQPQQFYGGGVQQLDSGNRSHVPDIEHGLNDNTPNDDLPF